MSANGARNHCKDVEVWTDAIQRLCIAEGNMDQPVLLHVNVGEPQRADGAKRTTPPPACRLRPTCGTREASPGMSRAMGSKEGGQRLPERTDALICNTDE